MPKDGWWGYGGNGDYNYQDTSQKIFKVKSLVNAKFLGVERKKIHTLYH